MAFPPPIRLPADELRVDKRIGFIQAAFIRNLIFLPVDVSKVCRNCGRAVIEITSEHMYEFQT